jgi:hypothetical protein
MSKGHKIITSYDYPPIPDRSMDWSAVLSGYDGADIEPGVPSRDPIGRGPTELSAISDLLGQLAEDDLVETLIEIGTAPWK